MTRTISLIIAVVAAASLLAVAPVASGQATNDAFDRALGSQASALHQDAFERAAARDAGSARTAIEASDAFGRAVANGITHVSPLTDAFGRALQSGTGPVAASTLGDQHDRGTQTTLAAPTPASSESGIAWAQVALGFGLGIALALGLGLATKLARPRALAH